MAKYIPDIHTKRWVIVAPGRLSRPDDNLATTQEPTIVSSYVKAKCPFCAGNEGMTPPEIYRFPEMQTANSEQRTLDNWQVRVVPNKYPITDIHEVIIHSPDHNKDIAELSLSQVVRLLTVYRLRYQKLSKHGQVLIFNNHGREAGESLSHPHSQVVVIPGQIKLDVLAREPVANIVYQSKHFIAYCPEFSQWPYEIWLAPEKNQKSKIKNQKFGDINDDQIEELGRILQEVLKQLEKKFANLAYNYYIYPGENWYLRIIPRLIERAGFELGTGLSVNVAEPSRTARELGFS